jgi:lipopolysaccharide cholinephosphotransferase
MLIGYIFSFMSYTRWCRFYNRWISSLPEGNFLGIPTARKHFLRGRLRRNVFLPTAVGSFENKVVPLPGNVHKYLDHEYGNYMDIPDINKRERHFVVEFDTGNAR